MGMYAKLMSRITESSLMEEPITVRYCFMMLLAIADPKGYVVGTDIAIARRMNLSLHEFRSCVVELMKPDPNSNSKEEEGRRVIESDCERGYYLVNYTKYRDTRDEEHRREYMRDYMRKYRNPNGVADVNSGKQDKPPLAKAEGEAKAEEDGKAKAEKKATSRPAMQTDDEWIVGLKAMDCYKPLSVETELGKARAWCSVNNRQCTRKFFTNWLNRSLDNVKTIAPTKSGTKEPGELEKKYGW
jgi:hypothetical protein